MTWIFLSFVCTISLFTILAIGFKPKRYRALLCAMSTIILVITLFFGLKPEGYRFINQVEWLSHDNGIAFKGYGMIHSDKALGAIGITDSMTIIISMKSYSNRRKLSRIISIVNIDGDELLTFDQWSNGISASFRRKGHNQRTRKYLSKALSTDSIRTIIIGICGGLLWLESENAKKRSVKLPPELKSRFLENSSLFIGYSASGINPWHGELYRLTISTGCSRHNINTGDSITMSDKDFFHYSYGKPVADFLFKKKFDRRIVNKYPEKWDLLIPAYPKMHKYDWPQPITNITAQLKYSRRSVIIDLIVNLFGFIPLGAVFMLLFVNFRETYVSAFIFTSLIALLASTSIELLQIFIPTRTSQMIDIVLNTIGACIGTFSIHFLPDIFKLKIDRHQA